MLKGHQSLGLVFEGVLVGRLIGRYINRVGMLVKSGQVVILIKCLKGCSLRVFICPIVKCVSDISAVMLLEICSSILEQTRPRTLYLKASKRNNKIRHFPNPFSFPALKPHCFP